MRVRLMHPAGESDPAPAPGAGKDLERDLGLEALLSAMAAGDDFVLDVARATLLARPPSPEVIAHRQQVLADCLADRDVVHILYELAGQAVSAERRSPRGMTTQSAEPLLHRSMRVLELLLGHLRRLRDAVDPAPASFRSPGLRDLADTVAAELDDDFFTAAGTHLQELRFRHGMLLSASLASGGYGTGYVLRHRPAAGWTARLHRGSASRTVWLGPDDEAARQAQYELTTIGIRRIAVVLAQSVDHVVSFFAALRRELAFYVGCVNLHDRLTAIGSAVCFPQPGASGSDVRSYQGLYDPVLVLGTGRPAIPNDLSAEGRPLVVVTGANEGGKSTFLRSLGVAQLMMQAGMFVPARAMRAPVATGVFTHFRREEDATMTRGKLDEELARMARLVDGMAPGALLLSNESFASTNEREGAALGEGIVGGLLDSGVSVCLVTHLFELADVLRRGRDGEGIFLRTERRPDGSRTYRLLPGDPEPTSSGRDLFDRIIGAVGR